MFKFFAAIVLLAALVGPLCNVFEQAQAQKTIRNSYQQSVLSGSQPQQSVYGGYQSQQSSSSGSAFQQRPVAFQSPAGQRQTSYQSNNRRTEIVRQPQFVPQQQSQYEESSSSYTSEQAEADAEPASYGAVAGQPGRDFPNYSRVPKTSFSCDGLPYDYGMYADEETGCQAYHVCYNGRKDSFLCGPGTVFNQRILHCDYWYSVECGKSSQYYSANAYMGSSQPEPGPAQANAAVPVQQQSSSSSSYSRTQFASPSVNRPAGFQRGSSSFNRNTQQVQESY